MIYSNKFLSRLILFPEPIAGITKLIAIDTFKNYSICMVKILVLIKRKKSPYCYRTRIMDYV